MPCYHHHHHHHHHHHVIIIIIISCCFLEVFTCSHDSGTCQSESIPRGPATPLTSKRAQKILGKGMNQMCRWNRRGPIRSDSGLRARLRLSEGLASRQAAARESARARARASAKAQQLGKCTGTIPSGPGPCTSESDGSASLAARTAAASCATGHEAALLLSTRSSALHAPFDDSGREKMEGACGCQPVEVLPSGNHATRTSPPRTFPPHAEMQAQACKMTWVDSQGAWNYLQWNPRIRPKSWLPERKEGPRNEFCRIWRLSRVRSAGRRFATSARFARFVNTSRQAGYSKTSCERTGICSGSTSMP